MTTGESMIISPAVDWQKEVTSHALLSSMGADPEAIRKRKPEAAAMAAEAVQVGIPLLQPSIDCRLHYIEKVVHERIVLTGGHVLKGSLPGTLLAPARAVVVGICTIGPDLEKAASDAMISDVALAVALDAIGTMAVEILISRCCDELEATMPYTDSTAPLSPGYVGWPLEAGQKQLFSILALNGAGVALNASCQMKPSKSISFVMGFGEGLTRAASTCEYCGIRETCRHRHAA